MGILSALLGYGLVKGVCNEAIIASNKSIDQKLKEIEWKYVGGRYSGHYMTNFHPRWDDYCDEVNPLRIRYGMKPFEKTDTMSEEKRRRRENHIEWQKKRGYN